MKKRERELAESEEPIRMTGPLNIQLIAKTERKSRVGLDQLVGNRPVVDPKNARLPSIPLVDELLPLLPNIPYVHSFNSTETFRENEIGTGFLRQRIKL